VNAIDFYRVGNFLYRYKVPILPKVIKYLIFLLFNSIIPYRATIGSKTRCMYGGIGVVIHSQAIIGSNVAIGQGVTIGRKLVDSSPVIGDNVYIAAGSKVLGDICIGNNVIIGANAVVIHDVPSNSIVVGSPARVVRKLDVSIYDNDILGNIL